MKDFIAQGRILLSQREYTPCYELSTDGVTCDESCSCANAISGTAGSSSTGQGSADSAGASSADATGYNAGTGAGTRAGTGAGIDLCSGKGGDNASCIPEITPHPPFI